MRTFSKRSSLVYLACSLGLALAGTASSAGDAAAEGARTIDASTIVMGMPAELGALERPSVEFKHRLHTEALEEEGCTKCHSVDEQERLTPKLDGIDLDSGRDALMDQYHDVCMKCHKDRANDGLKAGPITCGECHERLPAAELVLQPLPFDYSLHYRHIDALDEKCESCHHVYSERTEELVYEEGAEDACRSCHGDWDDEKNLSLRNAAHLHCVSCHFDRQEEALDGGPVLCMGCHGSDAERAIETLAQVPRLMRGQKDEAWISDLDARFKMVPFDHEAHEQRADFCTTCHSCMPAGKSPPSRESLAEPAACKECHTLSGNPTLEVAFHLPQAEHSCVGCHLIQGQTSDCAGCHVTPERLMGTHACDICHSGPLAQTAAFTENAPFPETNRFPTALVHLFNENATPDDFPDTVIIDTLADEYEPVEMPHRKIVIRLDAIIRNSKLATHFHTQTEILCSGCHHHTPIESRPTSCGSCHGAESEATVDMPSLVEAYHRQCIGCHQKMGIEKQGCTDCHARVSEEVVE